MRWWIGVLSVFTTVVFGLAEQKVSMRFHDAITGRALPAQVVLTNTQTSKSFTLQAKPNGRLELALPEGEYQLLVAYEDYHTIGTVLRVDASVLPIHFYLDPLEPPKEVQTEFLWSLRKSGEMMVVGWIMDEESGQPVADVLIQVEGSGRQTRTDERGFFLIQFPVAEHPTGSATLVVSRQGYCTRRLEKIQVWSGGDVLYRLTLEPGDGVISTDMRSPRHRENPIEPCQDCDPPKEPTETLAEPLSDFFPTAPAPIVLPKYIRVGRNCTSRTSCQYVEVYTLETYCKGVITSEWYSCWGNLPGGMESLKAGAVAVRSYAVSFVYSPASSQYDICDSTACQVFTGNQTSNGNAAVDATTRYVLLTASGTIARSEYSAENNNSGCGDGYTGTGSSWTCIYDPVCTGFARNGHGRGMCQWGSARWATGRRLSSSQACTTSAPLHGYGTKNWQEILAHYYAPAGYQLVQGGTATIANLTASPNPITAGSTGSLTYTINATHDFAVMLGASIRLGAGNWISDSARDLKVNILQGTTSRSRQFLVPNTAEPGTYDVLSALWFDRNNSNTINTGDFIVDDRLFSALWSVRRATVLSVNSVSGRRGASVTLQATLRQALDNAPLSQQTLSFRVAGIYVGDAITNTNGTASLSYTVPLSLPLGTQPIRVDYAGNELYAPTIGTAALNVQPVLVQGQVVLEGRANPEGMQVRFTLQQGSSQEVRTLTLGTGGSYQFETNLAGNATLIASTPNGNHLCQSQTAMLSNVLTLNFSLKAGDVNQDGVIDDADLLQILFDFGQSGASPSDLNGDGVVDDADLLLVLFNFGSSC